MAKARKKPVREEDVFLRWGHVAPPEELRNALPDEVLAAMAEALRNAGTPPQKVKTALVVARLVAFRRKIKERGADWQKEHLEKTRGYRHKEAKFLDGLHRRLARECESVEKNLRHDVRGPSSPPASTRESAEKYMSEPDPVLLGLLQAARDRARLVRVQESAWPAKNRPPDLHGPTTAGMFARIWQWATGKKAKAADTPGPFGDFMFAAVRSVGGAHDTSTPRAIRDRLDEYERREEKESAFRATEEKRLLALGISPELCRIYSPCEQVCKWLAEAEGSPPFFGTLEEWRSKSIPESLPASPRPKRGKVSPKT